MPLPYFLTSRLAKLPMAILIGGAAWLLWTYPRSTGGAYGWLQSKLGLTDLRLGIATAILIAIYIALMLWTVYSPWRKHSPDDAMGVGCVLCTAAALGIAELILAAAIYFQLHFLILVIAVCIFGPTIPILIGLIAEAIKALRKRRAQ
jgi:hypothetical protein